MITLPPWPWVLPDPSNHSIFCILHSHLSRKTWKLFSCDLIFGTPCAGLADALRIHQILLLCDESDMDFLDYSHNDIFFHQQFCSLIYNDDNRALHDLSTDSTMTSLLLCDKPTYLFAYWSCYATPFSSSSHRSSRDTTALATRLFRYRLLSVESLLWNVWLWS